ncbi:alkylhydroperoxidase [Hydrogenophaga crassostreae]|uniref:Alkylhydroperoxidase n=1 Tax=Hydrogenophaga crassostreae TaxID=1763535 RepID=A0A163C7H2_9BURK|nr:carboxymuconolactone decarboxylase family protein [Hydrogenophaga crassostreae]AOW15272.1 alkylhydroperoxidase [Hydrogenophaga crassostreae]OAD39896.1 alkylhydroperoxidase [Hydrogenophaga crassostreae]
MSRIAPVALAQADPTTQATLNGVKAKLGMVPNLFATFARSPAALNGYLAFSDALSKGRLSAAQRELIALAVGQTNACQYCLSAHTLIGKGAGLSDAAMRDARSGTADNAHDKALVELAVKIVRQRGVLADSDLADAAANGVDHGLVIEVTANVALNVLTNYTNHIAGTDVDFPVVAVAL